VVKFGRAGSPVEGQSIGIDRRCSQCPLRYSLTAAIGRVVGPLGVNLSHSRLIAGNSAGTAAPGHFERVGSIAQQSTKRPFGDCRANRPILADE
jgi:hypothetical protein